MVVNLSFFSDILLICFKHNPFQASPTEKFQPSRPVISFCTAVVVEVLGSLAVVETDVVKRILPYVFSGFKHGSKGGLDHQVS